MNPTQLIAHLNSIGVGDLETIRAKLALAREACASLNQEDLERALREADESLVHADLKTYRKRLATVIARLGHLR